MGATTQPPLSPARRARAEAASPVVQPPLPGLPPGWVVVTDCVLLPVQSGQVPDRIPFVLLHADFGIVLVEIEPASVPDAEGRLRHRLAAALDPVERRAIPVLRLALAPDRLDRLGRALQHALASLAKGGRVSGGFWMQPVLAELGRRPGAIVAPPGAEAAGPEPVRRAQPCPRCGRGQVAAGARACLACLSAVDTQLSAATHRAAAAWPGRLVAFGAGVVVALGGGLAMLLALLPQPASRQAGPRIESALASGTAPAAPALLLASNEPGLALRQPVVTEARLATEQPVSADVTGARSEVSARDPDDGAAAVVEVPMPEGGASPDPVVASAADDAVLRPDASPPLPGAASLPEAPAPDATAPVAEPDRVVAPEPWPLPPAAAAQGRPEDAPAPESMVPLAEPDRITAPEPWSRPPATAAQPPPEATPAPEAMVPFAEPDSVTAPEPWSPPPAAAAQPPPEATPAPEAMVPFAEPDSVTAPEPWSRPPTAAAQAPPSAAPAAPPAPSPPTMEPAMVAALIRRGDQMLALGDVSAARLLYGRAAAGGSGAAALALGRTHDPAATAQSGARGLRPDPAAAAAWYRRALALGEGQAEALLRALPGEGR